MALETAVDLIVRARKLMNDAAAALKLVNEAYRVVNRELSRAKDALEQKRVSNYPEVFADRYARFLKTEGVAATILKEAIDRAILVNEEFDTNFYRAALINVANNEEIYRIVPYGAGWNTKLSVIIGFEDVAGTLSDWARGVEGYRDVLGVDVDNGRGLRATNWWFTHVYRTSNERITFQGRESYSGRPASFWQILNSGTPSGGLESDRGDGSFNPVPSVPTDFIGEAETLIQNRFQNQLLAERNLWYDEMTRLEDEILRGEKLLKEIDDLVDQLNDGGLGSGDGKDEALARRVIDVLTSRSKSGDLADYASNKKILEAIRKYRAGEEFTTQRIELTAKNAVKRVRPRVSTFIRIVEGYEEL